MPQVFAVQFMHPGAEHNLKNLIIPGTSIYNWNKGDHRRKFMKASGQYVDSTGLLHDDDIYFWGEWEPWSKVSFLPARKVSGDYPHFLHEPVFFKGPKYPKGCYKAGTNTDPFVFGDNFFYSLCRQYRKTGPTILNFLCPGSIILFGSAKNLQSKDAYFALDTVFVVSESRYYTANNYLRDLGTYVPRNYDVIMGFKPWKIKTQKLAAYKGASFSSQYEGMYSFVPCKVGENGKCGFERPKLTSSDLSLITNKLSQGFKAVASSISDNKQMWNTLRDILRKQGYLEGVKLIY